MLDQCRSLTYSIFFFKWQKEQNTACVAIIPMSYCHDNMLTYYLPSFYHVLVSHSQFHQLHFWSIWDNWNFLKTTFSQTLYFDFLVCQLAQLSLEFFSFADAKETNFGNVLAIWCFIYSLIIYLQQNSTWFEVFKTSSEKKSSSFWKCSSSLSMLVFVLP